MIHVYAYVYIYLYIEHVHQEEILINQKLSLVFHAIHVKQLLPKWNEYKPTLVCQRPWSCEMESLEHIGRYCLFQTLRLKLHIIWLWKRNWYCISKPTLDIKPKQSFLYEYYIVLYIKSQTRIALLPTLQHVAVMQNKKKTNPLKRPVVYRINSGDTCGCTDYMHLSLNI